MRRVVQVLVLALGGSVFALPVLAGDALSCNIADEITDYDDSAWASVVLDTHFRLRSDYAPKDLVSLRDARIGGSGVVRSVVIADLAALAAAARSAGVPLEVQSAYRTFAQQQSSFHKWVLKYGRALAITKSARPGHSEHQLGTTIDFRSHGRVPPWRVKNWGESETGRWLARNAWRYGFVLSYPDGARNTTCYEYEPWHFRYFGRDVAAQMHASGKPPRVWLLTHPTPTPTPTPTASSPASPSPTNSLEPTAEPTAEPTVVTTAEPTIEPTSEPTFENASEAPAP